MAYEQLSLERRVAVVTGGSSGVVDGGFLASGVNPWRRQPER
jgi:hypothetical protein